MYFFGDTNKYFINDIESIGQRKLPYKWWIILHFVAAASTLFLGPIQFLSIVRNRYTTLHRNLGKIYIIGSLLSAFTVFILLATSYSLPGAVPSLGLLALIWIFTTIMAYLSIRKGQVIQHKQFMIRSYVCGLAFIFIRLLPEIDNLTGLFQFIEDPTMRYTIYEWICWVYPLIITEFFLTWYPQLQQLKSQ